MANGTQISDKLRRLLRGIALPLALVLVMLGFAGLAGAVVTPSVAGAQEWRFGFRFGDGGGHFRFRPPPRRFGDDDGYRFHPRRFRRGEWRDRRPPPRFFPPPQAVVMPPQYTPSPPPEVINTPSQPTPSPDYTSPDYTSLTTPSTPAPPASALPTTVGLAQLP